MIETKIWTGDQSVANGAGYTITVTGFSWDPESVLGVQVGLGIGSGGYPVINVSFPGAIGDSATGLRLAIKDIVLGTNQIQVTLWNQSGATRYINSCIVTAVKN